MKTIDGMHYYTSTEVCLLTNRKKGTVLKYARKINTIKSVGDGNAKQYYWTQEDLDQYLSYLEKIKSGKIERTVKPATNLMTLYQRKHRAAISGDTEKVRMIEEEIKLFNESK